MRVLIAPDSFGDTLTAVAAADAIARGWLAARASDVVVRAPQSDGGPGFVDVLAARFGEVIDEQVSGPLGAGVTARWLLDDRDPDRASAYIECAQACGLSLLGGVPTPRTALAADTRGVGELLDAALRRGVGRVVVGLGGSASSDGGYGMIDALGGAVTAAARFADIDVVAATDVDNPLLGRDGAVAVFGPQKGADTDALGRLEDRMSQWARVLAGMAGADVSGRPGAGAAGGLGAALLALGGRRASGAELIAEATGRAADVASADLVITGEGKLDQQTLSGKVVAAVTAEAVDAGIPVVVLAGQIALSPAEIASAGIVAASSIVDEAGSVQVAMNDAGNQLARLAERVARDWH
ncbi:glycerate kinase [Gordonia sinesedis]